MCERIDQLEKRLEDLEAKVLLLKAEKETASDQQWTEGDSFDEIFNRIQESVHESHSP